jgi:hypothetical protein
MENDICQFQILQNPSRKYANTVNLVFFRAYPIYKNFQKYIDGLKNWKRFMQYYPHSQLQIFVDKQIASEPTIAAILSTMDARVYLFDCPEYKEDDHHVGLFPTMMRFYPIFDINTHAMRIAHVQELEPDAEFVFRFKYMELASRSKLIETHNVAMIYGARNFYETLEWENKSTFDEGITYPWIVAGRFTMTKKIPFKLWTDFLEDIDSGSSFVNKYIDSQKEKIKREHGKYHFGVDEAFLNDKMLPWLIDNDYGVGIVVEHNIAHSVWYLKGRIMKNSKSKQLLDYILQKNQPVKDSLHDFDKMFYKLKKNPQTEQVASRFYEVVEKVPDWLGRANSALLTKVFKGIIFINCMIITRNKKIVAVQSLE